MTAKSQLTSAELLTHFDPDKKLILSCNASPYGVLAVLATNWKMGQTDLLPMLPAHWHLLRENTHRLKSKGWQ